MKVILASNNKGKIREIREMLGEKFEVFSLSDVGFFDEIEENGNTFEENAYIKVHAISSRFPDYIVIADDSGLCVEALDGAPGVYSARYSGEHGNDAANIQKLLGALSGFDNRKAYFASVIAVRMPDGDEFSVMGKCHGSITDKPVGENGFGYDPVFYVEKFQKTMAQLSDSEKNSISHRGEAIKLLLPELDRRIK